MKTKMAHIGINKLTEKELNDHLHSITRILKDQKPSGANSAMFYVELANTAKEIEKKLKKTQTLDIEKQHHEAINKAFVEIRYILKLRNKPSEKIEKIENEIKKIEDIDNEYFRFIAKNIK